MNCRWLRIIRLLWWLRNKWTRIEDLNMYSNMASIRCLHYTSVKRLAPCSKRHAWHCEWTCDAHTNSKQIAQLCSLMSAHVSDVMSAGLFGRFIYKTLWSVQVTDTSCTDSRGRWNPFAIVASEYGWKPHFQDFSKQIREVAQSQQVLGSSQFNLMGPNEGKTDILKLKNIVLMSQDKKCCNFGGI